MNASYIIFGCGCVLMALCVFVLWDLFPQRPLYCDADHMVDRCLPSHMMPHEREKIRIRNDPRNIYMSGEDVPESTLIEPPGAVGIYSA